MTRTRDSSIETLRGIAIILMVAGHVVGAEPNEAMQVPADSPWRFIFWGLQDLRMPLFTVLSGFVYAARPTRDWTGYGSLTRAKVRRLMIPLAVVGTLVFLAKLVNPASTSGIGPDDWWKVYVFGLDHLWFLQSIFLIFVVVGILDVLGVLDRRSGWMAALGVTTLVYASALLPSVAVFSVDGAVRLLPFFLLGYGLRRFVAPRSTAYPWIVGVVLVAAFAPRVLSLVGVVDISAEWLSRSVGLTIGFASILILFHFREAINTRILAWIGGFAFGIYLFHYFALPAVWISLAATGLDYDVLEFVLAMVAGIGLPMVMQVVTRKSPWLRLILFGEKLRRPVRSEEPVTPRAR